VIRGNQSSGMVTFSGCHLSCNFCYTPETSVHKIGTDLSPLEFAHLVDDLVRRGARNINLISPTHVWSAIRDPLRELKGRTGSALPIVLKISGFEKPNVISQMSTVADVFVPDFKVFGQETARHCGLPYNYGSVAVKALREIMNTHGAFSEINGSLSRGILVRHLMMPDHFEDSLRVVGELAAIGFNGYFNIMTYFVEPMTGHLHNAAPDRVHLLAGQAQRAGMRILINGTSKFLSAGGMNAKHA
jgi:putative pyruvate formate lyase activating enzyme